ncbi:unnamed protein product [Heterobilharzia americana]|nr:unnamed protein product [Heterobilharzia americana]
MCKYFRKENSRVRDEIFKENSFQITRLNLPQLPDLLFAKAKILLKQSGQSITQAYYDLKKAVHYCPAHSKSFSLLNQLENLSSGKQEEAIMSMLKYRFLDALQSINVAIYAQPENTSLYFDKGAILRKLDRLSESVDSILQGMHRLDTLNISAQNNLSDQYQSLYQSGKNQLFLTMSCYAIKLFKDGNYQESNALTCQLLKVDPTNYRLLILFGDCQYQMHNYEDSLKEYENAKSIINKLFSNSNQCICNNTMMFPESLKSINQRICLTCYNLSKIRIKQNDCLSALTFLNRCIQLAPFNSEFYMTRALVHYQLSNAKQSWDDVLVFVYLNLSDWALCQNTNGKWPTYPVWYQSIVHNRFICQVNEQIGPLIHRLTPKYIDLVKVAQSKNCELCNNTNYTKSISTNIASDIEQKFENTVDWLNKHVSFNLFSEAYETDDSSNVIDDQKKCKNIDHAAQLKSYSTIKEDYQKIKKEILNIRQKKYLR